MNCYVMICDVLLYDVKSHTTLRSLLLCDELLCDVLLCDVKSHTTLRSLLLCDVLLCDVKSHNSICP